MKSITRVDEKMLSFDWWENGWNGRGGVIGQDCFRGIELNTSVNVTLSADLTKLLAILLAGCHPNTRCALNPPRTFSG